MVNKIKLYHFTSYWMLPDILVEGLTLGNFVNLEVENSRRLIPGHQWLTKNPSWDQSWEEPSGNLPYRRNDYRLTIEIDKKDPLLKRWFGYKVSHPVSYEALSAFGDPWIWWVYQGVIPPSWIVRVIENPRFQIMVKKYLVSQ